MQKTVEADVFRLRGIRDSLTLSISNLEMSVEGLKEELICLANSHKEVGFSENKTQLSLENEEGKEE